MFEPNESLRELLSRELRDAVSTKIEAGADPRDLTADLQRRLRRIRDMRQEAWPRHTVTGAQSVSYQRPDRERGPMVATTYALFVGINEYQAVAPLRGCRNDVTRAAELLRARAGDALSPRQLCDRDATKAAVVDAFRQHLGQAGPGDTALFWFSGHGSTAPVPAELWHLEPSGQLQTLLCVDSRRGEVTDLLDKELAVLIREVAGRGAHMAVVLDCCHADGGTRGDHGGGARRDDARRGVRDGVRAVAPLPAPPPLGSLLPELWSRDGQTAAADPAPAGDQPDHVVLAACLSHQLAHERKLGGEVQGLFSWALLAALRQLGPTATYRELLTATRCGVENLHDQQVPRMYPAHSRYPDQPFLGGRVRAPVAAMVMRHVLLGPQLREDESVDDPPDQVAVPHQPVDIDP